MGEIREGEENPEEGKEAEFEDLRQEIKSFFVDPFDPGNEILVKHGKESNSAKVEATINESEGSSHISGGFTFQVAADILFSKIPYNKTNEDTGYEQVAGYSSVLDCQNVQFKINDKLIKFDDISPKGTKLIIEEGQDAGYGLKEKTVVLGHLARTEDLISLLHEVGHAIDFKKRSVSDVEADKNSYGIAGEERNAWAEALKIARKYNIPITDLISKHAQFFMESYDQDMGVPATNKSRRELKNK